MRPVDPSELHTIPSLHKATGLPEDTLYDIVRDTETLGRRVGFKLGRRWYVHPDDWDAYIAARRGVKAEGLPAATSTKPSRRAS